MARPEALAEGGLAFGGIGFRFQKGDRGFDLGVGGWAIEDALVGELHAARVASAHPVGLRSRAAASVLRVVVLDELDRAKLRVGAAEDARQRLVVALRDGIVFVIVAAGAGHRRSEEG